MRPVGALIVLFLYLAGLVYGIVRASKRMNERDT